MNVWELGADADHYVFLNMVDLPDDLDASVYRLWGEPLIKAWAPVPVYMVKDENVRLGDFLSLLQWHPVVYTERVLKIIQPLVERYIEFLPLLCDELPNNDLRAIHATTVLNCLDHDRSEFEHFPDGRIMYVKRYVFRQEQIGDVPIFKIPEARGATYVTDSFKTLIEENELTGLLFIPLAGQTYGV